MRPRIICNRQGLSQALSPSPHCSDLKLAWGAWKPAGLVAAAGASGQSAPLPIVPMPKNNPIRQPVIETLKCTVPGAEPPMLLKDGSDDSHSGAIARWLAALPRATKAHSDWRRPAVTKRPRRGDREDRSPNRGSPLSNRKLFISAVFAPSFN